MARVVSTTLVAAIIALFPAIASAQPSFVNGLVISGDSLDATQEIGANAGRLGFFSDIYYDPTRNQWWALSDRGPGGGVLDYGTRVQRFKIKVDEETGAISRFRVHTTIRFTDPRGLLTPPTNPNVGDPLGLNGQNPLLLNDDAGVLGRSFDPEGFVVHPTTGHFLVSDEYRPSVYEFNRKGRLVKVFETPANLLPRLKDGAGNPAGLDFVAGRSDTGIFFGRQDNRGFEGLAIEPGGARVFAVLQDPLTNEPPPNNGRDGRNVRIVEFDSDPASATYGMSIAQYAYQLEPVADIKARIVAAGGTVSSTDPRQGRNIGLSAVVAINDHEFLVLERDNRGIGVDNPQGLNKVGSKRVFKIDIDGATDVTNRALPAGDLSTLIPPIVPVTKVSLFIDLQANTVLPNGQIAEKWEGLTIGPKLEGGAFLILAGNDNDYSVTQTGSGTQFDVYVDFNGGTVQRDIDSQTLFNGADVGPVPAGFSLLPGVLHAYRVPVADLGNYVKPRLRNPE